MILKGIPFVLIAAGAMSTPQAPSGALCVARRSLLRVAMDFQGKIIAVNVLKSSAELAIDAWLARGGADLAKVHLLETNFSEMGPGLERGAFDAAFLTEPALSLALRVNNIRRIGEVNSSIAPSFLLSGFFAAKPFAQGNREAIKRFVTAIAEAGRWANAHHDESAAIISTAMNIDSAAVRGMTRITYASTLRPADLQAELDAGTRFGFLPRSFSATELIDR
jgi:NitT/TauT family transport system substrate-binding protein